MTAKKIKSRVSKVKQKTGNKARFMLRHPLVVPSITFVAIVFVGLAMMVALGATTQGASDNRIVNVYVDEEQQTVITRAKTVEDLLNRLEIKLIPEDIVEPSRDSLIFEDNTQVNVYRARPVDIEDEDRIITVLTAQRAPRMVAAEAGIELHPEDEVRFGRSEEGVLASAAGETLIIDRSQEVQLNVYGVITSVRTTVDTVGELLEEQGITVEEGGTLQPEDRGYLLEDGLLVSVNKEGIKTEADTEKIPYETIRREDSSLTVGESLVKIEGENGERAIVYEISEGEDGEVLRRKIQTVITKKPISRVVSIGTKPATLSSCVNVSSEKTALMAAAGISPDDYVYVDFIIHHESTWRPGAVNSSSGAYGLCQSLPASKMASAGSDYLTNPVTQLKWCSGYAKARYGGWQGAYNAWLVQRWW